MAPKILTLPGKLRRVLREYGLWGTLEYGKSYVWERTPWGRRVRDAKDPFDERFGTDTSGVVDLDKLAIESDNRRHGVRYQATPPVAFAEMIASLPIRFEDHAFVDFGSGKGRALLLASDFPFRQITGVEFSPTLHAIAEENLRRYRSSSQRCTRLRSVCLDALELPLPDTPAVLYFYNPFAEEVMSRLLGRVRRSLEERPRSIYVIFYHAVLRELLAKLGPLELFRETPKYCIYRSRA
jgi:SAM-dependent methyltransferase